VNKKGTTAMPGGRKIQANYDDLANVANQFSQMSSEMQQVMQQIASCVSDLQGGGWIGRGAQAFYAEMDDLVTPALQRLGQALEDASNAVTQVSNVFSNAEHDASSLFRR